MDERGAVTVISVIIMVGVLMTSALVVDMGVVYIRKSIISNVADAAVLAGAQDLIDGDESIVVDKVIEYCEKNNVSSEGLEIIIEENALQVVVSENVQSIFSKVMGVSNIPIQAKSKAIIGSIVGVSKGIRPFAVIMNDYEYGEIVTLKLSAGDGTTGNYNAIALGGTGANNYKYNIVHGYDGDINVGDLIDTEPGNMKGPTKQGIKYVLNVDDSDFDNLEPNSLRIWTLPVVDTLEVDGRKQVTIVGFSQFFVESVNNEGEINGRFVEFVTSGEINPEQTDYGLKAVKLVRS